MPEAAKLTDDQQKMLDATQNFHELAMDILTKGLEEYAEKIKETPTNATQFAAIDGMMAATGQVLAAMTLDAVRNSPMDNQAALEGGIGTVCLFQKTLLKVYLGVLETGKIKIENVDDLLDDFEKRYREGQK